MVIFNHGSARERKSHRVNISVVRTSSRAGAVFFAIVFAVAFVFGTFRVLVLVPRIGVFWAVLLEGPVLLTVSWIVARWCVRRFAVPALVGARALMGVMAFGLLMAAELGMTLVSGGSVAGQIAGYGSPAGAIGLAAQVTFGVIPVVQIWRPAR